jgi:ParB family chromosome partitioning protein
LVTADHGLIRTAARKMLAAVLSCRENISNSGIGARVAGETISASAFLPTMATDEFLSCLSRQALERSAGAEGVRVEVRVKDTRARMVERFKGATYHYPGALFVLTAEELDASKTDRGQYVRGHTDTDDGDAADGIAGPDEDLADEAPAPESDDAGLSEAAD